jgi:hypothetical protein
VATDINNTTSPAVEIRDGTLVLDNFVERSQEVVSFVAASDDGETAVHRIMQVGTSALSLAQTTIETKLVEHAFGDMTAAFDGTLGKTVEQIGEIADGLLDEESGELVKTLESFADKVGELLGETFDEDSKSSALAKLDRLLTEAADQQVKAVRRVVDSDDPDSPLGRHRAEIVRTVREAEEKLTRAVADLSERIAVTKAQADLAEKAASKGFDFEDAVHEVLSEVTVDQGDLAEQVGAVFGAAGTKAGDELVTLSLEDTRGLSARYVLELKDRKLGAKATFEELERAMANREAAVGIAVFSRQEHAPIPGPFAYWGNYAIVVLDKDELDPGALRLACLWARWMVRRELADDSTEVSLERVAALIEDARRALDRVTTVRRCHTSAAKRIGEAGAQVDEMATQVQSVLDAIASEIAA